MELSDTIAIFVRWPLSRNHSWFSTCQSTPRRNLKCQYCLKLFKWKSSVTKHRDNKFCNQKLTYPLLSPCYFCGKPFSKRVDLNVHMKTVHLKESSRLCNLCRKYFSSTAAINRHIRSVHLLERNYKCQLCSKKLSSYANLNQHIQSVHTKEKTFKCYFCPKSFVNFGGLRRHMFMHSREKPLTCYFCRKDFKELRHLSAHIGRIHTNERPFKCIQCPSRCYSTKRGLNLHVRIKHDTWIHLISEWI
jgi:hypothetical protein